MALYVTISTVNLKSYITIKSVNPKAAETLLLMRAIQTLWTDNIKRFFDRSETRYPPHRHKLRSTSISELFHCELRGDTIVGIIDTSDAKYINYLIYGAPPSRGAFIPALGGRINTGVWRGIPTIYWMTWQSFFKQGIYSLISLYEPTAELKNMTIKKRGDLQSTRATALNKVRSIIKLMEGTHNGYL